jgi:hypothetical protein
MKQRTTLVIAHRLSTVKVSPFFLSFFLNLGLYCDLLECTYCGCDRIRDGSTAGHSRVSYVSTRWSLC